MNQIFRWSPAVRTKDNGDKYGVFQCKCPSTTRGAKRQIGETPMVKWDYWAVDAGRLSGTVVWLDKTFTEFNNKVVTNIVLALKTKGGDIDILYMPFDGFTLRNVMNNLSGMRDDLCAKEIILTHGVWKKKEDGKPVIGKTGEQVWSRTVNFEGVTPFYDMAKNAENGYWEFREKRDMIPLKTTNRKGEVEYDDSKELEFWDKCLVAIQRKIVELGAAIPFSYNSWICGELQNPTGGGNQDGDMRERIKDLYQIRVKGQYQYFNASSQDESTADDVRANMRASGNSTVQDAMPANPTIRQLAEAEEFGTPAQAMAARNYDAFPTEEPAMAEDWQATHPDENSLPF